MSAPPPPAATGDPVDPSVLVSLLGRLGRAGPAMLPRLLETWETENERRLEELRVSAGRGDAEGVAGAAQQARAGLAQLRLGSSG